MRVFSDILRKQLSHGCEADEVEDGKREVDEKKIKDESTLLVKSGKASERAELVEPNTPDDELEPAKRSEELEDRVNKEGNNDNEGLPPSVEELSGPLDDDGEEIARLVDVSENVETSTMESE